MRVRAVGSAAVGRLERADLHAGPGVDLGAVVGVIEHAGQAGVNGVDVIAAVEVVIDVHLPVAGQFVLAPGRRNASASSAVGAWSGSGARKSASAGGSAAAMDPDQRPPNGDGQRRQAVVLAAEVGDAVELRGAAQPAGQVVGPAVIAAAQPRRLAARLRRHGGRPMAADVGKGAQHAGLVADDQDRLAGDFRGEERSRPRPRRPPGRRPATSRRRRPAAPGRTRRRRCTTRRGWCWRAPAAIPGRKHSICRGGRRS